MAGGPRSDGEEALAVIREHTQLLAEQLHDGLRRIRMNSGDIAVEVEWDPIPSTTAGAHPLAPPDGHPDGHPAQLGGDHNATPAGESAVTALTQVNSPIVGTFYRAPEPGAKPFVDVGDTVDAGQVVGIVEAMKLMNPITAESAGRVEEILVANAEPVEFDQILMTLTPIH